jgi:hypothetical protein
MHDRLKGGRRVRRSVAAAILAVCLPLSVAGTASAFTGTASTGVLTQSLTGTFANNFAQYSFGGGAGSGFATLANMANPLQRLAFVSKTGTFTVTEDGSCLSAVLNGGPLASGFANVAIYERKAPFFRPGRSIQTGGKTMKSGDFIEACSF